MGFLILVRLVFDLVISGQLVTSMNEHLYLFFVLTNTDFELGYFGLYMSVATFPCLIGINQTCLGT
jgi:hypothetical protein